MADPYTGNPAHNPTSITLPQDGDLKDAAVMRAALAALADMIARRMDAVDGGVTAGSVEFTGDVSFEGNVTFGTTGGVIYASGNGTVFANQPDFFGGFQNTGGTIANTGTLTQDGNATFGAACIADFGGRQIVRAPVALTSAGRIKGRTTFLDGTAAVSLNAANADTFIYEGLTASRNFTLTTVSGAEDGDEVEISLVSLGANANTVHVITDAATLILDLKNASGSLVCARFKYASHAPAGWRCIGFGVQI